MDFKKQDIRILVKIFIFLKPYGAYMAWAFISLLAATAFSLVVPRLVGDAVDAGLARQDVNSLFTYAVWIVVTGVLRGVFTFLQSYFGELVSSRIAYDIRNALYDHIQRLSFDYHGKMDTAQLMSRATADVDAVRWFISFGILRTIRVVILFFAAGVLLYTLNWQLTLVSFACLPIIGAWAIISSARTRQIWAGVQQNIADMGTVLHENLTGIRVVKAFHRENYEVSKFAVEAQHVYAGSVKANIIYSVNTPAMSFILLLATGLILWLGGRDVIAGKLTPGELSQFILYLLIISQPVRMLGYIGNVTSRAVSAGERIFEVLEADPTVKDSPNSIDMPRSAGLVRFENVSFSYDSADAVLRDVSFEAKPGEVIALVGATGSGKTTIISLIPRFYDVTGGRITIDGSDIRKIKLASLRRNLGIVQQDVFLFSASIHDNIAYGRPDATRAEVEAAAKAAHLHEFVASLPKGYDTWVGERGITLSGGQRQRLAIARTILTDPPILILDDATSSVDTETEYLIQQALANLLQGRTTLVIAQRLSTIKRADLILVIQDGRIVERGRHEELVRRSGYYRRIYDLQLRDQEEASTARHNLDELKSREEVGG
jgi:ABC-type multidrug transport system fused ATPase/permease subunit